MGGGAILTRTSGCRAWAQHPLPWLQGSPRVSPARHSSKVNTTEGTGAARSLPGCSRPDPWRRRCRPPLRAAVACTVASSSGERRGHGRGPRDRAGRRPAGRGAQAEGEKEGAPVGRGRKAMGCGHRFPHTRSCISTGVRFYI